MNKAIIAVVAIVVIGGGAFVIKKNNDDKNNQQNAASSTGQPASDQSGGEASGNGSSASKNELDPDNYTDGANIGSTVDATDKSEVSVSIDDFIFKTTYLKIKKGTKVTWTNDGQIGHTVTSAETSPKKGLESQLLNNGESYSFTFSDSGLYEYFCAPHPTQMKAVITVVD